jgi:hypothetical protein
VYHLSGTCSRAPDPGHVRTPALTWRVVVNSTMGAESLRLYSNPPLNVQRLLDVVV